MSGIETGRNANGVEAALRGVLDRRIVVIDGSYGVLIHRRGLSEEAYRGERFHAHGRDVQGDPDLLNLTAPDVVLDIHRAYLASGADVVTTNTFTATSIGQADYGLEAHAAEMSLQGARLARLARSGR
jgi:5-methyltetrahydrofolate--homocysteine methyltransferase